MKIIFCGGCNPLYQRVEVYEKLKELLEEIETGYDYLILNGCHRGCRKVDKNLKVIKAQDFFIENSSANWTEEKIIEWILKEIK
ncbi:MAG: hypothetical protein KGV57_00775 [Fusobacterium sp.]|nr:hypothetical protein [Fusobacterium sp.]